MWKKKHNICLARDWAAPGRSGGHVQRPTIGHMILIGMFQSIGKSLRSLLRLPETLATLESSSGGG